MFLFWLPLLVVPTGVVSSPAYCQQSNLRCFGPAASRGAPLLSGARSTACPRAFPHFCLQRACPHDVLRRCSWCLLLLLACFLFATSLLVYNVHLSLCSSAVLLAASRLPTAPPLPCSAIVGPRLARAALSPPLPVQIWWPRAARPPQLQRSRSLAHPCFMGFPWPFLPSRHEPPEEIPMALLHEASGASGPDQMCREGSWVLAHSMLRNLGRSRLPTP